MTADNIHKLSVRNPNGTFAKGSPGRPVGAKGKKSRAALEQIKSFGPDALQALYEAIQAKERWAVEYCLNKIVPSNSRTIEFEGMDIDDIREAFKAGDISVSELSSIVSALEKIANVEEIDTLKERVENLEAVANAKSR